MHHPYSARERLPESYVCFDKLPGVVRRAVHRHATGRRHHQDGTGGNGKSLSYFQEDVHELGKGTVFYLYHFDALTIPFPPRRDHRREILIGKDKNGGGIHPNIDPFDLPAENRVLPLASSAGESAGIEGSANVPSVFVIKNVHSVVMPLISIVK